jgi:hypothetical protein
MVLRCKQLLGFVIAHAGIRLVSGLAPLNGRGTKVLPARYGMDERVPLTRCAVEERIITEADDDEITTTQLVALASVAVQAHAFSAPLLSRSEAGDLGLPLLGADSTPVWFRMAGSQR